MRNNSLVILLISFLFMAGCSNDGTHGEEQMLAIEGEIVKIEEGRFLVESPSEKLPDGNPAAIWFTADDMSSLSIGQKVSVWTTHVQESYPGQAEAERIEIHE